jgi:protein SCO1/2
LALVALFLLALPARAQPELPEALRRAAIEQKPGAQVPLDVPLRDESGREVRLGDFLGGRPAILVLAYYRCPRLCSQVLNDLLGTLRGVPLEPGKDYTFVTVSFDPDDKPALAAAKKAAYLEEYGRPGASAGWHFLTGDPGPVRQVADAVGFNYYYDPQKGQYAHDSGIMILTPEGRVSRYFFGLDYQSQATNLRLALVEASSGKIGSPVDQVLLFCLSYDPATGRYRLTALNAVRLAGVVTVLLLGAGLLVAWRRERRKARARAANLSPLPRWGEGRNERAAAR